MIFIARYKNYKLGIRPTIRQVAHGSSGSEEIIVHKGVTVDFVNAMFDTKRWREFARPESPDHINVVKSEDDLIRLIKGSQYYDVDFFERKVETVAEKRAKLQAELSRLEAEEAAENPDDAPTMDVIQPEVTQVTTKRGGAKTSAKTKGKGTKNSSSKIML